MDYGDVCKLGKCNALRVGLAGYTKGFNYWCSIGGLMSGATVFRERPTLKNQSPLVNLGVTLQVMPMDIPRVKP